MGVVGLKDNIPYEDGLQACKTNLNRRKNLDSPTDNIIKLARLVLTLNSFQYEEKYYLQVHSTRMAQLRKHFHEH